MPILRWVSLDLIVLPTGPPLRIAAVPDHIVLHRIRMDLVKNLSAWHIYILGTFERCDHQEHYCMRLLFAVFDAGVVVL